MNSWNLWYSMGRTRWCGPIWPAKRVLFYVTSWMAILTETMISVPKLLLRLGAERTMILGSEQKVLSNMKFCRYQSQFKLEKPEIVLQKPWMIHSASSPRELQWFDYLSFCSFFLPCESSSFFQLNNSEFSCSLIFCYKQSFLNTVALRTLQQNSFFATLSIHSSASSYAHVKQIGYESIQGLWSSKQKQPSLRLTYT